MAERQRLEVGRHVRAGNAAKHGRKRTVASLSRSSVFQLITIGVVNGAGAAHGLAAPRISCAWISAQT